MYDRIVASPGNALDLGLPEGGQLLIQSASAGAMPLTDMLNRVWHLLREPGPDTGDPVVTVGDFNITTVTRDLNIAIAQFISETGIAPAISERMLPSPVFAVLDYPLPPDLVALTRIEYTPQGQYPYVLIPMSFTEFDQTTGGLVPPTLGNPRYYRAPYAGYIRLQPAPGLMNATGPAQGTITFSGVPLVGQIIRVALAVTTPPYAVTVAYTVTAADTITTLATNLAGNINASLAVQGINAFLQPATVTQPQNASIGITLTATSAILPPSAFSYSVTLSLLPASQLTAVPTTATLFQASGDLMTIYYTSLGRVLIAAGDTPGIPLQFHMAIVYRVLVDYWQRKSDQAQSQRYEKLYDKMVMKGKSYTFDSNRASQPTIAGDDYDDFPSWP